MSDDLPRHEPREHLFDALVAPFQPTASQRQVGRLLLALIRIPGTLPLLRAWHTRRGRGH